MILRGLEPVVSITQQRGNGVKLLPINRRKLLTAGAASAAGLMLARAKPAPAATATLRIDEPLHGAVLNRRHGEQTDADVLKGGRLPESGTT